MAAQKIKGFRYVRKSTDETQNKQLFSIPDQISDLVLLEERQGVEIVESFEEQKSAKAPYIRPGFDDMLKRLEAGEASVIVCWHINRLARNPVDAGRISWLLQTGVIRKIITPHHTYLPEDNSILLALEAAMANEQVRDLAKFVQRGMQMKAEKRQIFPGLARLGYINYRSDKVVDIRPDTRRWDDVRRMWDLLLSQQYTVPEIQRIANEEWQFRTPILSAKRGGKPISRAGLYGMYSSIFYTGLFEWKGETYQGSHKPMITMDEFNRAQEILGRRGKPKTQEIEAAYTGQIRCGECGDMFTYTEKWKTLATTGERKPYRYYHCYKRKRDASGKAVCSQKPITLEALERQISLELEKFTVSPEFVEWALEELEGRHEKEVEDRSRIRKQQEEAYHTLQRQMDNLTSMRYRDLIDDEEFAAERSKLKLERSKVKLLLNNSEHRADAWEELTDRAFHFASHAKAAFDEGPIRVKKEIFSALGSNYVCKDKIVSIEAVEWLEPLIDRLPELQAKYEGFEPQKTRSNERRNEEIADLILLLCSLADEVRTAIRASRVENFQIPRITAYD